MSYSFWVNHLRTKKHIKNDPDQTIKPRRPIMPERPTKRCEECNVEIVKHIWYNHLKTLKHLKNEQ
jgi:hypothetical protein